MIRHTQSDFDVHRMIEEHLVTPTLVTTAGLLGRFDTLRVALEHLLPMAATTRSLPLRPPMRNFSSRTRRWVPLSMGMPGGYRTLDFATPEEAAEGAVD